MSTNLDKITEWMAVPPYSNVYLEAVETAKDTQTKTAWTRTARTGSLRSCLQSQGLLADGKKWCGS